MALLFGVPAERQFMLQALAFQHKRPLIIREVVVLILAHPLFLALLLQNIAQVVDKMDRAAFVIEAVEFKRRRRPGPGAPGSH